MHNDIFTNRELQLLSIYGRNDKKQTIRHLTWMLPFMPLEDLSTASQLIVKLENM